MHKTAHDWDDVQSFWNKPHNFRLSPNLLDFDFDLPPLEDVIDQMRADEDVRIKSGDDPKALELGPEISRRFRALPIETAMNTPFALAHFDLGRFDAPGKFLHGFSDCVLDRWQSALSQHGFTWERCYPIIFTSGKGCLTNYHMDFSHVIAWQVYGEKRFCGLRDPDLWADKQARLNYKPDNFAKPDAIREEDSLCYDMRPGDKLWNVILTPHWVEAGDEAALSFNISHGGLRHHGQLAPNEQELEDYRAAAPDRAPEKMVRIYQRAG